MRLLRQTGLLIAAAGLCAFVQGLLVPRPDFTGADDPWVITAGQAAQLARVLWIDARPEASYNLGHYPDALHLSLDNWDIALGDVLAQWDPDSVIVVYCDAATCESSREIAARLRTELASDAVFWLLGGWPSLQAGEGSP